MLEHMLVCYFYIFPRSASSCLQVSSMWPPGGYILFLMWKSKSWYIDMWDHILVYFFYMSKNSLQVSCRRPLGGLQEAKCYFECENWNPGPKKNVDMWEHILAYYFYKCPGSSCLQVSRRPPWGQILIMMWKWNLVPRKHIFRYITRHIWVHPQPLHLYLEGQIYTWKASSKLWLASRFPEHR